MQPTSPKLIITPRPVIVPPWVAIGLGEIGVVEDTRPGRSTLRVEGYHQCTMAGRAVDDISWCSSYVGYALESAGLRSTRSKTAASYKTWGVACGWVFGAVIVFPKSDPDSGGSGHVGFLMGLSGADVFCLGGNQGNRVSIAVKKKAGAVCRWPEGLPIPPALDAQAA